MTSGELLQRVRFYLNERDLNDGQPVYLLLLERLRREGATGATALRGLAGFGPGYRARASGLVSVTDAQPVVIEWVDRVERVARVMPFLDDLVTEALVTIEDIRAYRARLRSAGPFGTQTVGELMDRDALAVPPTATVREAIRSLLPRTQVSLPVVDSRQQIIGLLHDQDLVNRAGLPLPVSVLRLLHETEQADLIRLIPERPLSEFVGEPPRTSYVQSAIPQVVAMMLEWGLLSVPVIDRDGRFIGLVETRHALQAARDAQRPNDGAVRDAEPPPPVRLLMQTTVATIALDARLPVVLRQLLAAPEQVLVVIEAGQPTGVISLASVLAVLEQPTRTELLQALRSAGPAPAFAGADPDRTAAHLAAPAVTILELATQDDAIRSLLDQQAERLVVINAAGSLVGMLGRRALLRGLAQLSA